MNSKEEKSNEKSKKVILLNKPFLGNWLDNAGNIGHEIIDFLKTDKGELYIYNNPYGQCPGSGKIGVNDGDKKYNAKYLVLTGKENAKNKSFEILYVVELEKLLHRESSIKNKKSSSTKQKDDLENRQKKVREEINNRNIIYNGKKLYEIWKNDNTLYVTFKASNIYRAVTPISVEMENYNFQRNKGCLYENKFPKDFERLNDIIDKSIKNNELEVFQPRQIDKETIKKLNPTNTFIDLIMQENNEQIFTNILFSVLRDGGLFNLFCKKFKKEKEVFQEKDKFNIFRENSIVQGRMDICAESNNQRIIIENKINSGLNGLKPKDNKSQLSTYYGWGKKGKTIEPLCFVVVPDSRKAELLNEIHNKDQSVEDVYNIVTYKDISEFLKNSKSELKKNYAYEKYVDDIILAFDNLSKLTKEDLYARLFIEETLK